MTATIDRAEAKRASLEASLRRFLADAARGNVLPEPPESSDQTKARVVKN